MKLFNSFLSTMRSIRDAAALIMFVAVCICYIIWIGREILQPLSPVFTLAFVIFGTLFAFQTRRTAVRSIFGIILYAASWPIYDHFGVWPMIVIYVTGFALWFEAGLKGFLTPMLPAKT